MNWQKSDNMIVHAVGRRGYLEAPVGEVFAAQIAKMIEELAELNECAVGGSSDFREAMALIGRFARGVFDKGDAGDVDMAQFARLLSELADLTVVLHIMWAAANEMAGRRLVPEQEALRKATKDVERGVR